MKPGRNDVCPCGSGKKYKKCCLEKDELLRAAARAEEAARAATALAAEGAEGEDATGSKPAPAKGSKPVPKQERPQGGPRTGAPAPSPLRRRSI